MSSRYEWVRLAAQLRAAGRTKADIAQELRLRFGLSALASLRHAHGWSQGEAAREWTKRWPDNPKAGKDISDLETGRWRPSLDIFDRLAQLYACDLADLFADRPGYRHRDEASDRLGTPVAGGDLPAPWQNQPGLASPPTLTSNEVVEGGSWQVTVETTADLELLVGSYRRAYAGKAGVTQLLPVATGLMHLLTDLGRQAKWRGDPARLSSLIGQTAVLSGLLYLMGHRDLDTARTRYNQALQAAYDAGDWDLASYVLGSLAFEAVSAQRPADARELRDTAWDVASRRANPRTRSWVAALASELYARDQDEAASRRFLDYASDAMDQTHDDPLWKGVGWFDATRLEAYEGGNLLLLGQYEAAAERLKRSLDRLEPERLKHRSTLSADLAMALTHLTEVDEACKRAGEALTLATVIAHRETLDRIRRVHTHLLRWKNHPGVRELTERLQTAA